MGGLPAGSPAGTLCDQPQSREQLRSLPLPAESVQLERRRVAAQTTSDIRCAYVPACRDERVVVKVLGAPDRNLPRGRSARVGEREVVVEDDRPNGEAHFY